MTVSAQRKIIDEYYGAETEKAKRAHEELNRRLREEAKTKIVTDETVNTTISRVRERVGGVFWLFAKHRHHRRVVGWFFPTAWLAQNRGAFQPVVGRWAGQDIIDA